MWRNFTGSENVGTFLWPTALAGYYEVQSLEQGLRGGGFEEEWVVKLRAGSVTQNYEPLHNRGSVASVCDQLGVSSIGMQSLWSR
jgi:hypothetical protein